MTQNIKALIFNAIICALAFSSTLSNGLSNVYLFAFCILIAIQMYFSAFFLVPNNPFFAKVFSEEKTGGSKTFKRFLMLVSCFFIAYFAHWVHALMYFLLSVLLMAAYSSAKKGFLESKLKEL